VRVVKDTVNVRKNQAKREVESCWRRRARQSDKRTATYMQIATMSMKQANPWNNPNRTSTIGCLTLNSFESCTEAFSSKVCFLLLL